MNKAISYPVSPEVSSVTMSSITVRELILSSDSLLLLKAYDGVFSAITERTGFRELWHLAHRFLTT
ncbi:hypothetical protein PY650_33070 [Rhizobium calliandrae]|uniref:Uncharacterized protein n=1 Tax=Rhizobium calliandrae TaxID=1312182 RepID=A0ABT7KP07_9HYPH|nr:hypothetical protein [Rhizobium calliandrae]MDL2410349.1 hypothetical protein [Rhizobium calliandrae]